MLKLLLGAAVGFAAGWFLDPDAGTRRRKAFQEKAPSYGRKGKQDAPRGDHVAGQVEGAVTPTSGPAAEASPVEAPPAEAPPVEAPPVEASPAEAALAEDATPAGGAETWLRARR